MKEILKEEMGRVVVPEDLAKATLQKMYAENARLKTSAQPEKKRPVRSPKSMWLYALPAAACLCLIFGLSAMLGGREAPFSLIDYPSDPRLVFVSRAAGDAQASAAEIDELCGVRVEEMLPGYAIEAASISDFQETAQSGQAFAATADLSKGDKRVSLTVSSFESTVYASLTKSEPRRTASGEVYVGRDKAGALYAGWPYGNAYCVLESRDFSEEEFWRFLKDELVLRDETG